MVIRKHILFYGRVQGVGFRYYSVHRAQQLGLTGWVRNLYDGSVEMEVQGEPEHLEELIQYLQNQRFIRIDSLEEERRELKEETDFREVW